MDLETVSQKHLNELEHCVSELLTAIRKAKVQNDPLVESLKSLEQQLGKARRERFDSNNTEFHTY